jgi:hypothetical protein
MAALEARSAIVSASLMRQSRTRESMISTAATAPAAARRTSSAVQDGPVSGAPSTIAISASTLGWSSRSRSTSTPSGWTPPASTGP